MMSNFVKFSRNLRLILALGAAGMILVLTGCNDLLNSPQIQQLTSQNGSAIKVLDLPTNFSVKSGMKGKLSFSWNSVYGAQGYRIYRSSRAQGPFELWNYVVDSGAIGLNSDYPAGETGWFKLEARDKAGFTSELTDPVFGATLAKPLIYSISQDENTGDVTIYWFMRNLSIDTYGDRLIYTVECFDNTGKAVTNGIQYFDGRGNQINKSLAIFDGWFENRLKEKELMPTQCTFKGLTPGENFTFQVTATVDSDYEEKSTKVDKRTAESYVPDAPVFTVTKGAYTDKVEITITLPTMCGVPDDDKNYPVSFTIKRRESGTTKYETIASYVPFNSTGNSTTVPSDFSGYTAGNTIVWTDTVDNSVTLRGVDYQYLITSTVDNYAGTKATSPEVLADKNKQNGWAANFAEFEIKGAPVVTYTPARDKIEKVSLNFNGSWKSMGSADNVYLLEEIHENTKFSYPLVSGTSPYFDKLADLNSFIREFTFANDGGAADTAKCGYYKYKLYVINASAKDSIAIDAGDDKYNSSQVSGNALVLTSCEDSSKVYVTNDITVKVPEIKSVTRGYKDKCTVNFTAAAGRSYKLYRYELNDAGEVIASTKTQVALQAASAEDVEKNVESSGLSFGKGYAYQLIDDGSLLESPLAKTWTLGQPVLNYSLSTLDYTTITVKWTDVSEAAKYNVTYTVPGLTAFNAVCDAGKDTYAEDESFVCTYKEASKEYTLVIKAGGIPGFHKNSSGAYKIKAVDAAKTGQFKVTAVSVNDDDTDKDTNISAGVNAHIYGPVKPAAYSSVSKNKIDFMWTRFAGDGLYAIRRSYVNDSGYTANDVYVVDLTKASPTAVIDGEDETILKSRYTISMNGNSVMFADKKADAVNPDSGYQSNQAKLSWGIPFTYSVIPLKNAEELDQADEDSSIYENLDELSYTSYTFGYGKGITASKATVSDGVKLTWKKPNNGNFPATIFYKKHGSQDWTKYKTIQVDDLKTEGSGDDMCYTADWKFPNANAKYNYRLQTHDFVINFDEDDSTVDEPAYETYLKSQKDASTGNIEQLNEGYALAVPEVLTVTANNPVTKEETFTETVSWGSLYTDVDFVNKPDSFALYCFNKNNGSNWHKVADIDKLGNITKTYQGDSNWYNVTYNTSSVLNGIKITPNSVGDTQVHDGLLKVQRDYKHYYALVAYRNGVESWLGKVTDTASDTADYISRKELSAVRKISKAELAQCVSLIVADATYQAGKVESEDSKVNGVVGTYQIRHKGATKTFFYGTGGADYRHIFRGGLPYKQNESFNSSFTVNMSNAESRSAADGDKIYHFPGNTITVTHDSGYSSYEGSVYLEAGIKGHKGATVLSDGVSLQWDLTLQCNGTTVKTVSKNETELKKWFPYHLSRNQSSAITSYNTDAVVYTGTWWEVR